NGGGSWTKLKGNVPNIPFRDLVIQTRENDLVGATFGRSFYILDDYTPLRDVTDSMLKNDSMLFPVRKAHWYVPKRPLGCDEPGCGGSQGDGFYIAENPDFGATFTYYLNEELKNKEDQRREAEKEKEKNNENVTFASWETILSEQREDDPAMVLVVKDSENNVVRMVDGPVKAGFHRVSWDLRYPPIQAWVPDDQFDENAAGVLVAPGQFSVTLHKRTDGTMTQVGESQTFDVVSIREPTLAGSSQPERVSYENRVDELIRASSGTVKAIDAMVSELDAMMQVLMRSRTDGEFYGSANSIKQRAIVQKERLTPNQTRSFFQEFDELPLTNRLWHARFAARSNAYGPTPEQTESMEIAQSLYADVKNQLNSLFGEYDNLKRALDDASVPWSPGRGVQ
ncbi:MAG: hypothetical protein AAF438_23895, partial [Pseudomonadota bacterium]